MFNLVPLEQAIINQYINIFINVTNLKMYIDKRGYPRDEEDDKLIHRKVAYRHIYLQNRDIYPLPFGKYVVHHIDGDKQNFRVKNLEILTRDFHEVERHGYFPWIKKFFISEFVTLLLLILLMWLIFRAFSLLI